MIEKTCTIERSSLNFHTTDSPRELITTSVETKELLTRVMICVSVSWRKVSFLLGLCLIYLALCFLLHLDAPTKTHKEGRNHENYIEPRTLALHSFGESREAFPERRLGTTDKKTGDSYGEIRVIGLERCAEFTRVTPPGTIHIAPAGLFNTVRRKERAAS